MTGHHKRKWPLCHFADLRAKVWDRLHGQMDLGPRRMTKIKLKFDLMPNYLRFFGEHARKMVKCWSKLNIHHGTAITLMAAEV